MEGAQPEQGLEGGHRGASAVVAEDELVEVDLQVLGRDAAVGALQPGLQVGERSVGARQELLGVGAIAPLLARPVPIAGVGQPAVAAASRRCGRSPRGDELAAPTGERVAAGVGQDREAQPPRALTADLDVTPTRAFRRAGGRLGALAVTPPTKVSSTSTSPRSGSRSGATIARRSFCRISQAVS